MKTIAALFACAVLCCGQHTFSTNFSADLEGPADRRPRTWGTAEATTKTITFMGVPAGHRVRILRVYGDFLAWPMGTVAPGRFAGVLLGLQSTAEEGSKRVDWGADNTMLYVQTATSGAPARIALNQDVREAGLLEPDNKLVVKMAAWLNDTGRTIHVEPSLTVVYRYEPAE